MENRYLVLDTNIATSRVFKLEDGKYYHWYAVENEWYWVSTHHWGELDKSTVLFRSSNFEKVLPFLQDEVADKMSMAYLDVQNVSQVINIHLLMDKMEKISFMNSETIADCILILDKIKKINALMGRIWALERDIKGLLDG